MAKVVDNIEKIVTTCRERKFMMDTIHRIEQGTRAYLRTSLGWGRAQTEKKRKEILEHVDEIWNYAQSDFSGPSPKDFENYSRVLALVNVSLAPLYEQKADREKLLDKLVKELPIYQWWKQNVFATSTLSLATLIGEAGNLSNYPETGPKRRGPACLYKRMGVAVIDGQRQGKPVNSGDAEEWIKHGYNPRRRSVLSVIGSSLVRTKGRYYTIYKDRKEQELQRFEQQGKVIVQAGKYPKGIPKTDCVPLAHIDNRARRYTEKRLLKDLWREWNQC